ncbi:MAG TPA: ERAP1-like C-terminal domain-containing protein, partial [Candidatus Krumholzibacteria bacterium]|nr:ERAP1-like C-terminal domain-containing protein [Candidatus Krumholzibacteria bacterium]
ATILNERERVGFIGNLSALLDAGALNGGDYLFALGKFADDPQPQVISSVLSALGKVELAFVQPENEIAFAAYVRATLGPALERFGAEPRSGEDEQIRLFRPQLLEWLGDTGKDVAILEMAENLARRYVQDPHSIDAQLSGVALQLSAIRGDRALFDDYRQRFESAQVPADRNRYLGALANFRDPEIIEEALRYTLTGPLRSNELLTIPGGLVGYPPQRDRVFRWLTENYDAIGKRLPPEFMGFMPFMAGGCSAERLAKAQEFFGQPQHQAPGTTVQLAKVGDQVHDCVGLHEREGAAVAAFLDRSVGTR